MNILLIGSKGFIGRHCVHYFRHTGHAVIGCDILPGNEKGYIRINALDPDFNQIFASTAFDVCINASGSASVSFSLECPEEDYKLNVTNVERMLKAINKYNPNCRFINFSSAAVYGNPVSLPVKESDTPKPLSPYGEHKLQSELLLKQYHEDYGIPTCSLRVFSAYGPGLKKQLFWDIYQKANNPGTALVELFGTGCETRDFIYIDDLILSVSGIMRHIAFEGQAINIASGKETSIREAANVFLDIIKPGCSLEFTGKEKAGDPAHWLADIRTLRSTGFVPGTALKTGLQNYFHWLRENA